MQETLQRPPEGSRRRILQILQRQSQATVDNLARQVGLAPATVRRHLDILQRDHLVSFRQVKKKTGRPEYAYYLTDTGQEALPKAYSRFLTLLVNEVATLPKSALAGVTGEQLLERLLERVAQRALEGVKDAPQGEDFPSRLARVQAALEQEGFAPEIEQLDGSARIHLHNCPFRASALENPALCYYDIALLGAMFGTNVVLEESIRTGGFGCVFRVSDGSQKRRKVSSSRPVASA